MNKTNKNSIPSYKCDNDLCNNVFIPKKSIWNKKYNGKQKTIACGKKCANEIKHTGEVISCDNCGKQFYRNGYHINRQKNKNQNSFCSLKCEMENKHKQFYEFRLCEICGKEFECSRSSNQHFCSIQCQGKWQSTQKGKLNPRTRKIDYNCDYCGTPIMVKRYKLNEFNHFFCGNECRQKWYAEVWCQQETWREESRERALYMLENHMFPTTDTEPQRITNKLLEDLNIDYQNEYNVKYYSVDNLLLKTGLMIEVMGDYWHGNPLVYDKDSLSERQIKRSINDKAKHSYIKNNYNVEVLYLWESDLYNRPDMCSKIITEYIDKLGVLPEYHSFNYSIDSNNLILNPNRIIPYQEIKIA